MMFVYEPWYVPYITTALSTLDDTTDEHQHIEYRLCFMYHHIYHLWGI